MAFYNVKITPKQEAAAILFEVAAKIYPPMILTTYLRLKIEADKKRKSMPLKPSQPAPAPSTSPPKATVMPPGFDPGNIKLDS